MRFGDLLRSIRNVLRNEMPVGQRFLRLGDHVRDVVLPFHCHTAEIRLVANLVVEVVELVQLRDDFSRHRLLHGEQRPVPVESVDIRARDVADAIHVVDAVLW